MRSVITGLGVAAPTGVGAAAHWATVLAGESRIARIGHFDPEPYETTLAGEVPGFEVTDHVDSRVAAQTDRWTWLAFAAAEEALGDADADLAALTAADPYVASVALASSTGGNLFGQRELQKLWHEPAHTVGAYQSIAWFYAATVGQLSIHYGLRGPSGVLAAEAAGGLDSFGHAVRCVRRGTSLVLAGGTECPLSPYALACQQRGGQLSVSGDPARAYRPFAPDAEGFVPGEGGAVLVVEDAEHARLRGAPRIYGEIAGWAATHDGRHTGRRDDEVPSGQYARAMRTALERAELRPEDVDLVFADAVGLPAHDRAEAAALREVFGPMGVPVTTQKALTGRLYQGGASLDVVTALLAMREGVLPHTAPAYDGPIAGDLDLDLVDAPRRGEVDVVMVNARGFDGYNSSLVIRRADLASGDNVAEES